MQVRTFKSKSHCTNYRTGSSQSSVESSRLRTTYNSVYSIRASLVVNDILCLYTSAILSMSRTFLCKSFALVRSKVHSPLSSCTFTTYSRFAIFRFRHELAQTLRRLDSRFHRKHFVPATSNILPDKANDSIGDILLVGRRSKLVFIRDCHVD